MAAQTHPHAPGSHWRDHTGPHTPQCSVACCARLPLIILAPMLLTPVPLVLLNMCGGSSDMFSEKPAGVHWAEFSTAFLATGCFAIPILLALTDSIEVGAALTSLAGTLMICALFGVRVYLNNKESDNFNMGM